MSYLINLYNTSTISEMRNRKRVLKESEEKIWKMAVSDVNKRRSELNLTMQRR